MGLERNHQVSRLWLQADAPLVYQVELADPQTVVVHLRDTRLAADLPVPTAGDPTVARVSVRPDGNGLAIVLNTKGPGVTVLPFYEAASRRLTLELGGAPSLEVKVPAAETEQSAPPKQTAKPDIPARAEKTPPIQTAKPSTPPPAPAEPAKPAAPAGPAPRVEAVRVGTHDQFTRVVLDGRAPLTAELIKTGQSVTLALDRGRLAPGARRDGPDRRIRELKVVQAEPLRLELVLTGSLVKHRLFYLDDRSKVVVDVFTGPPLAAVESKPAPKEQAQAQAQAQPAPVQQPEAQVSPAPKPAAPPQAAASETPAPAPIEAAPFTTASPPQPWNKPSLEEAVASAGSPPPPAARPEAPAPPDKAARPPVPVPPQPAAPTGRVAGESGRESQGYRLPRLRVTASTGAAPRVRGSIPAVAPPEPLARERTTPPPEPAGPVQSPDGSRASTDRVVARVVQANHRKSTVRGGLPDDAGKGGIQVAPPGPMPAPAPTRPPQAALLGPRGEKDRAARTAFQRAKSDLEDRRYSQAFQGFSYFLRAFGDHELAAEAQFRLADAFYHLSQKNMLAAYPQVMMQYQKAVDLYPESNQVPWALLMMGKASMLNEEPYKALGYYQVVAEDYPQSEYVPLALEAQARALLALGRPNEALEQFRQAVKRYPDSRFRKDSEWGMVRALFNLARYQRAALLLRDMMDRNPKMYLNEPEVLYYLGESEFQQGNYTEARRYFLWALNIKPDITDADIMLSRVGDTFLYDGDGVAARQIYTLVVANFPGSDGALVAQLRLVETPDDDTKHPWGIFQTKVTPQAQAVYRDIIDSYPQRTVSQLAQVKLAMSFYKQKKYLEAMKLMEDLLIKHPTTPYRNETNYILGLTSLGLLEQYKAENKPLELMDAYLRNREYLARPNGNEVLNLLAWAYRRTGLHGRAAKLYEVLVSRQLNDPSLHLYLAAARMGLRDYPGVLSALEVPEAAKLEGAEYLEARSLKGRALRHLGRWEQAAAILAPLVAEEQADRPATAEDYLALGVSLSRLGKYEDALTALAKAEEMLPPADKPQGALRRYLVAREISDAAKRAGRWKICLAACQRAEKLAAGDQDKAAAIYGQAQAQMNLKAYDKMAADFQRLAKMKVTPWSQMAARHLADMKLAPQLASVGQ